MLRWVRIGKPSKKLNYESTISMSFTSDLLDATKDVESPRNYFYWAALTSIASVLGKRVYLDRQKKYKLYPNIYTFLISKKSGLRKSLPVSTVRTLTKLAGNVRIIDGQNSIQGIIKELNNVHTTDAKIVINEAQGLLISGEFANFLIQDRDAKPLTDLTDMYDTHNYEDGFSKRLASQDTITLKGLCLNGLFGSNEVHFRDAVPDNAIRGGFLARCFCVYEEKRQNINSLLGMTEEEDEDSIHLPIGPLAAYLKVIAQLGGPMRVDNNARKLYNEWYYDFCNRDIEDETGTMERLGDTLLKASILIALARSPEMIIKHEDMKEAIEKTTECFLNVRKMILGGRVNVQADTFRIVMATLLSAEGYSCSRQKLSMKGWGIYTVYDLDQVLEQFVQSKAIIIDKKNGEPWYTLRDWVIDRHLKLGGKTDDNARVSEPPDNPTQDI